MAKHSCNKCSDRLAHHSSGLKSDIDKRISKIEGQIRGIRKMISEDKYCDDVLNQITSAQSALNSVRIMLLENHINSCVTEQLAEGDKSVIDELMKTIARMVR